MELRYLGAKLDKKEREAYLRKMGASTKDSRSWEEKRKDELDSEYAKLTKEQKETFIKWLYTKGYNLGMAREKAGISMDMASQIIMRNRKSYEWVEQDPENIK